MTGDSQEAQKRAAALAATEEVAPGMLVGLGTGTTAAFLIEALGARVAQGLAIRAVATSIVTAEAATRAGIPLLDMADVATVDLAIDGVDEIDPAFRAIKGGGGALLREKIVATAATRMIAIADARKQVARLARAVPVEVLPFASASVVAHLSQLGGTSVWRSTRSDQGNPLLDCDFGPIDAPERLAARLAAIPGLLGHGLFLDEIDALYLATPSGVQHHERNASVTKD
jgi:ribose 5-phosphate isomerase A